MSRVKEAAREIETQIKFIAANEFERLKWSKEDAEKVRELTVKYAELRARSAAGEDVTKSLLHVESQASSIAAKEGVTAAAALQNIALGVLETALRVAIG